MIDRAKIAINESVFADCRQFPAICEVAVPGLVVVVAPRKEQRNELLNRLGAPDEWIVDFPDQSDCGVFIANDAVVGPFATEFDVVEKRLDACQPVIAVGPFAGLGLRALLPSKAREANLPYILIALKSERGSEMSPSERQLAIELARTVGGAKAHGFQQVVIVEKSSTLPNHLFKFVGYCVNGPDLHWPFDVIGDVHGCIHELELLLKKLGYVSDGQGTQCAPRHAEHRKLVFAGDLVDRGPDSPSVVRLVRKLVAAAHKSKGAAGDQMARV